MAGALGLLLAVQPAAAADPTPAPAADPGSAVIFLYQRVGEDAVPHSSLSLEQFREHVSELKAGGYHVLPVPEIVADLKSGKPLPPKTVGLTFEGAWLATLNNVTPLLNEAKFPYTVFFSSDDAEAGNDVHMSWSQLKSLRKNKLVTLGLLPAAYIHMTDNDEATNAALINRAVGRYRETFREDPAFFAWPYGEYSAALKKQLGNYKFTAGFGQQSGVAFAQSDFMVLPRFVMTDEYGDIDRFRLTAASLPLPVSDVVPEDPVVAPGQPQPLMIGFTVDPSVKDLSRLSCFISDIGKTGVTRLGGGRVELRLQEPLQDAKTRVNCTLPVPGDGPDGMTWRWFGMILVAPHAAPDTEDDPGAQDDTPAPVVDESPGDE